MWIYDEYGNLVWSPVARMGRSMRVLSRVHRKDEGGGEGGGGDNSGGDGGDAGGADEIAKLREKAALADKLAEENERYKAKNTEAEKHRKEQEKLAGENARKAAAAAGDIQALEKSWGEKFTARETELTGEVGTYRGMVEELTAGSTAQGICNTIAMEGCAPALMPHVRARLKSEIVDGKAVTRVLDAQGNVSAMTPDDLIKELKSTPYLAPLIVGSKAGGAGNPGGNPGGGNGKLKTKDQVEAMDPFAKAAYFKESGGKYAD